MANEVDCGASTPDSFASYDPATSSWRTSAPFLFEAWDECSVTWPTQGTTRNGRAFSHPTWERHTDAIVSGLWPTPCTTDAKNVPYQNGKGGKRYPMLLGAVAPERMWPTPTSRDWKDGSAQACANVPANGLLGRVVHVSSPSDPPVSGSLNPQFCEWLMGYPIGWTALEGWATRLSRPSPSGSPKGSTRRRRKADDASLHGVPSREAADRVLQGQAAAGRPHAEVQAVQDGSRPSLEEAPAEGVRETAVRRETS